MGSPMPPPGPLGVAARSGRVALGTSASAALGFAGHGAGAGDGEVKCFAGSGILGDESLDAGVLLDGLEVGAGVGEGHALGQQIRRRFGRAATRWGGR